MVRVVIDTSVIIERVRTKKGIYCQIIDNQDSKEAELISSVVVLSELWAGKRMDIGRNLEDMERIIEPIFFVDVDTDLAKKAGKILREHQISGFDAVIAATALKYKAQLATLNKKHFMGIKGLRLYH